MQYQKRERIEEGVRDDMPRQGQHRLLARKLVSEIGIGYLCLCFFSFLVRTETVSDWEGGRDKHVTPFALAITSLVIAVE